MPWRSGFNVPVAELLTARELAAIEQLQRARPGSAGCRVRSRRTSLRRLRAHGREPIADALLNQRVDGRHRQRVQVGNSVPGRRSIRSRRSPLVDDELRSAIVDDRPRRSSRANVSPRQRKRWRRPGRRTTGSLIRERAVGVRPRRRSRAGRCGDVDPGEKNRTRRAASRIGARAARRTAVGTTGQTLTDGCATTAIALHSCETQSRNGFIGARPAPRGRCARRIRRTTPDRRAAAASVPLSPPSSSTRLLRPRRNARSCETNSIVPSKSFSDVEQHLLRREIEMVGRLVEDEEVRRIEQHARHHQPRLLAARERADLLVDVVAGELERAGEAAQRADRLVRKILPQLLLDRQIGIEQVERLLREVAHLQARAELDVAGVGRRARRRPSSAASTCRRRSSPSRTSARRGGSSGSGRRGRRGGRSALVTPSSIAT